MGLRCCLYSLIECNIRNLAYKHNDNRFFQIFCEIKGGKNGDVIFLIVAQTRRLGTNDTLPFYT